MVGCVYANIYFIVEPNGAVRVKKKWDYEELGPEKTVTTCFDSEMTSLSID